MKKRVETGTSRWCPPLPSAMKTRRSATCRSSRRRPSTSQRRSPPSTIAATIARSRWVRSAAVSWSTSVGLRILGQLAGPPRQRHSLAGSGTLSTGGQAARHRVRADVAPDLQVGEEAADGRQPPGHGAGRHPARLLLGVDRLHHRCLSASAALGGDEPEHVGGPDHCRWLTNDGEEHLQVVGRGEHGVGSTTALEELQILIQQRHAQPHHRLTGRPSRTDQTRIGQGHLGASSSVDRQPQRLVEMSRKITGITSRSGCCNTARFGIRPAAHPADCPRRSKRDETVGTTFVFTMRSRTRAAIAAYPVAPVVYRRPVLRTLTGLMLGGMTALLVWSLLSPPASPADRVTQADWWLGPACLGILGGIYLYVASRLEVDATHLRIRNPLRRADIPLAHVTSVEAGSHLRIETDYAAFIAWGVEAARTQVMFGTYGTQAQLAQLIRDASTRATNSAQTQARYRWSSPDPVFCVCALALALFTVAVVVGTGTR